MSQESPYSPPKSVVQDAAAPSRVDLRVLRDLARLVDNETTRLRTIRRLALALWLTGIVAVACALLFMRAPDSLTQWLAILGMIGGFLAGIASFYSTSLRQWPVLRRYLDVERIRADYESSNGQR
jgi:uncharacterized membrane protein